MNAITPYVLDQEASIASVKVLAAIVHALKDQVFEAGIDYGVIPGTGTKPVLLLPGMEKLLRALRLRPEYILRQSVVDFDKPLFYFQYECRLIEIDTGLVVSSAIGSANSNESKWHWRNADRACPKCEAAAIKRSKYPPRNAPKGTEPGWYCYDKLGGCGAEFAASDPAITGQITGRVVNPDLADQLNTIDKIAQKRGLSSSVKGVANVSGLYTVDLEDELMQARPLSGDDAKRLAATFSRLTPAELKAALGGPSGEWKRGYAAAERKISDWAHLNRPELEAPPAPEPDVIDAEFDEVEDDELDAAYERAVASDDAPAPQVKF